MKVFVIFFICTIIFVNCEKNNDGKSEETSAYTTKYDNIDLEEILHSDRLLLNYVNCLLDKSRCTPDGNELKKNLPDAIDNDCEKCSETQRVGSKTVIHFLIDNKPDWWNDLEERYNPDGSYRKAYLEEKSNENNNDCDAIDENIKD